jgi:hypothetical protein
MHLRPTFSATVAEDRDSNNHTTERPRSADRRGVRA